MSASLEGWREAARSPKGVGGMLVVSLYCWRNLGAMCESLYEAQTKASVCGVNQEHVQRYVVHVVLTMLVVAMVTLVLVFSVFWVCMSRKSTRKAASS